MINFIFSIIYLLVLIGIAIIDKKEHKITIIFDAITGKEITT